MDGWNLYQFEMKYVNNLKLPLIASASTCVPCPNEKSKEGLGFIILEYISVSRHIIWLYQYGHLSWPCRLDFMSPSRKMEVYCFRSSICRRWISRRYCICTNRTSTSSPSWITTRKIVSLTKRQIQETTDLGNKGPRGIGRSSKSKATLVAACRA